MLSPDRRIFIAYTNTEPSNGFTLQIHVSHTKLQWSVIFPSKNLLIKSHYEFKQTNLNSGKHVGLNVFSILDYLEFILLIKWLMRSAFITVVGFQVVGPITDKKHRQRLVKNVKSIYHLLSFTYPGSGHRSTLFLSDSPDILRRKLISAACIHELVLLVSAQRS